MATADFKELLDLDRELRSGNWTRQCIALTRFQGFLEQCSSSVVCSSGFLKLADFFKGGTNTLRAFVVKTCLVSQSCMETLLNADEIMRRVLDVAGSNDPVARALTFRMVGAFGSVCHSNTEVQYCIFEAFLQDHSQSEWLGILFASEKLGSVSPSFSNRVFQHIVFLFDTKHLPRWLEALFWKYLETSTNGVDPQELVKFDRLYGKAEFIHRSPRFEAL